MDRSIIHFNVADFAVAVETRLDRRLDGRPVIIAPEGAARAAVYDMSETAYRAGVRKAMPLRRALRRCRDARVLSPRPGRYEQAMTDLLRRALPYSPLVEPGRQDGHLFVDVTGTSRLFGPPVDVAWRMRRQIEADLGLRPIWSLAANKLVAKVASRLVKPLGEYIVAAGDEQSFLAPLPVWLLPGIEAPDLERLREFNLDRVFQARALSVAHLQVAFGPRAGFIRDVLCGIDPAPVQPAGQAPPQVRCDHEFGTDTNCPAQVRSALSRLVETAGRRLRRRGRAARRLALTIDYTDGRRCARQGRIQPASANDLRLFPVACRTLDLAWRRRVRLRRLALVCDRLVFPPAQMPLFADARQQARKQDQLINAIDAVRRRYGTGAVQLGRSMAA